MKFKGAGYSGHGWIEDDASHGDVTILLDNGRYVHFTWKVANPGGTGGYSGNEPAYYLDYQAAVANDGLYDQNFNQFHASTLEDETTGDSVTFSELGLQPSDIIFPIWEESLGH